MNNDHKTCDPERIELSLQQKLSDEEQTAFELHLDDCDNCRRRLEATAAGDDIWSGVRESLLGQQADCPPSDAPALDPGLDSTTAGDASFSHDTVLKLLAPTDDDRMLGRLGTYEVVGVVGSGGMGVVLKAFDAALNRYVAIKVLAPHLGSSGSARKRFSREAQAAAAVVHENVMEIHGVADAGGLPYLVMPYVRGPSLQRRLDDDGPLAIVEILRIGVQAATGLAAAHAQGLVHRDVKPANILLEEGVERVKLTDFGLARAADDASLTRTGVIAGTPQYMSPEQARGESVDQRSDLFSLGSVLYAMCTGRAPFRAETSYGVLRRITDEEPRPIRQLNPDIPEWLCRIVARLMSKQPGDRHESAAEVAQLLEECLAHVQQPTTVPLPASLVTESSGNRFFSSSRRSLGVIAMIAVFGSSLLGLFLWPSAEVPPTELNVRTTPPGATIFLDGKELGKAPNVFDVAQGKHELLAVLEGHRSAKRDIVVPATRVERVILTLQRIVPSANMGNGSTGEAKERQTEIEKLLAMKLLDVNFQRIPLLGMLHRLAQTADVKIVVDGRSLSTAGISPYTPITLKLQKTTLAQVLEAVLKPLGLKYETREGAIVVRAAPINGVEEDTAAPVAKTIFLPIVGTPDVGVALDLASGARLPSADASEFAQLDQGDLAYVGAFDGSVVCLRNASMALWNGKRFVQFKQQHKLVGRTAYTLPQLPCRLLINTADDKVFDVTILSVGKSGEDDKGIPGGLSGIRLKYEWADLMIVPYAYAEFGGQSVLKAEPANGNEPAAKAKTFFLPDAHTPGVGGVLDLASGEILAIDGEKGFFAVREFTRQYRKGDLYYGYDEEDGGAFIGCMRGATAVIQDGGPARPLEPSQKREDVTVYLLPPLPCRLLITTAEKKVFAVTILSAGKPGEGDTGVPRHISGIRLRYELADPEVVSEAESVANLTDTSVEQKVRDVIAKFAEAVVKGDKAAVTKCLHPKMYGMADRLDEAAESVHAGLKLAEIHSVFVRGDRALVATELAPINDRKSTTLACTVYTLVKIGESWVIEDIDMEDEKGRADEMHRFKNETPNEAEGSREQAEMFRRQANASCRELETAMEMYRLDMGTYPTTEAGLAALVEKPKNAESDGKWSGPYLSKLPKDPWGRSYRYRRVTEPNGTKTTIWSLGPDQRDGTDDDIRLGIDYDSPDPGRLDLRVAATRGDDGKAMLNEKDVENYINDLKTNGPQPARRRADPFAWFPMNDKPRPPLITADHGGQTFVLLANTPEHTMLRASTRPWGIASVTVHHELQGRPAVSVELDEAGGRQFGELTETHLNLPLAILIDDRVIFAPTVRTKITTRFQISGSFDIEEAGRLARTIMIGMTRPEPADDVPGVGDAAIPLPPPKTGPLSFGPPIERVVNDDKTGKEWMIDLDTGKLYTPPTELDPEQNSQADTKKLLAWVRQQGIDATGIKAQGGELQFIERVLAVVDKASWESVTQQQVRDALAEVVDPSDKAVVGDTLYAFRTREGGMGVLQVVGRGEESPSVKIRYKLVRTARDVATDFLTAMRDKDDEALKALATDAVTQGWKEALPQFAAELRHHLEVFSKSTDPLTKIEEVVVDGNLAAVKAANVKQGYLVLFFQRTSEGWRNCSLKNSPPNVPLAEHVKQYKAKFQEADAQPGLGEVDRSSDTATDVPPGWKVVQRVEVPADQTAAIGKRLGGRIEKLSNDIYLAHGVEIQVNVMRCPMAEDAEKIHASVLKMKGDPAYCHLMGKTVVEFVGQFDVEFAKRAAHELLGVGPYVPNDARVPLTVEQRDRARAQTLLSSKRILQLAVQMYHVEYGKYPALRDGWAELTRTDGDKGPFLKGEPKNPFTGGSTVAGDGSGDWQYDVKTNELRAVVPFGKEKADLLGLTSKDVVTKGEDGGGSPSP